MKDPYKHAEKTPVPGFGAMADLISRAIGLAPDLPKTVGTGCGRRQLSDTTTVPENVTCLACADYARAQQIEAAENAEALTTLGDARLTALAEPGKPALTVAQLKEMAREHRATARPLPAGSAAAMNGLRHNQPGERVRTHASELRAAVSCGDRMRVAVFHSLIREDNNRG
jgi:hypothetical protein